MKKLLAAAAVVMLFSGYAQIAAAGLFGMDMGNSDAKTTATGSAGGANSQNANSTLEHCPETLGTIAIEEDTDQPWFHSLQEQQLGPTTPVLKLLLQQSNCFVVVERGGAMRNMQQERDLAASGELRKTSKMQKGQMVAADYVLSPSVTFANNNAGGGGLAAIGGHLFGGLGALAGAVGVHSKEASTMLTLIDTRSSVQLAAAEGSAKNTDISFAWHGSWRWRRCTGWRLLQYGAGESGGCRVHRFGQRYRPGGQELQGTKREGRTRQRRQLESGRLIAGVSWAAKLLLSGTPIRPNRGANQHSMLNFCLWHLTAHRSCKLLARKRSPNLSIAPIYLDQPEAVSREVAQATHNGRNQFPKADIH